MTGHFHMADIEVKDRAAYLSDLNGFAPPASVAVCAAVLAALPGETVFALEFAVDLVRAVGGRTSAAAGTRTDSPRTVRKELVRLSASARALELTDEADRSPVTAPAATRKPETTSRLFAS